MGVIMAFALGFVLGFLLAYLPQWVSVKRTPPAAPDDAARRRHEQAAREYRNFLTYDGYTAQEDAE